MLLLRAPWLLQLAHLPPPLQPCQPRMLLEGAWPSHQQHPVLLPVPHQASHAPLLQLLPGWLRMQRGVWVTWLLGLLLLLLALPLTLGWAVLGWAAWG